jgi:hypothetical protein
MENNLFAIPEKELKRIEVLLKENEATRDVQATKTELVILYKLEQIEKLLSNKL